jgi:LmbE family N-acetylglucosaminyl deacetylase
MISRRPLWELSPVEVPVFEGIDGRRTAAELEEMHPGAGELLLKWHEAEILELIPPITAPARPHLVVIEPHMDDAVLSAAGRLLHRRGRCRITIMSVVRWSNFTSYMALKRDFLNVRDITNLRQRESALVARYLGAEYRCLDWTDAPICFWPSERWSPATVERFNVSTQTFVNLFPNAKDVALLAEQLAHELSVLAPDELWIPMGLGEHVDHRTTRNACLLMLARARGRFADVPVFMYEDLPYASDIGHAARIHATLNGGGSRWVRGTEDITDVFDEKLRAISIYASQFKLAAMEPRIRAFAEREAGTAGTFAEAYYRVEGKPHLPQESLLSVDWAGLAVLKTEVRALLARRRNCRRLAVMALPSGHLGRWKTDSASLVAAFPHAHLRVYAAEAVAWQVEGSGNKESMVKVVRGRRWGWMGAICRELFYLRTPTVVLFGAAYGVGSKRTLLRALLPFRHVLFVKTLGDLRGVLDEQLEDV